MQKDKELAELLAQHAMQETDKNFTADVMQKIAVMQTESQHIPALKQAVLIKILAALFVFICIVLLVGSIAIQPFGTGIHIDALPPSYTSQLIRFFIIFWVIMLANQSLKKNNKVVYK